MASRRVCASAHVAEGERGAQETHEQGEHVEREGERVETVEVAGHKERHRRDHEPARHEHHRPALKSRLGLGRCALPRGEGQ
jgi:hypothetical protein